MIALIKSAIAADARFRELADRCADLRPGKSAAVTGVYGSLNVFLIGGLQEELGAQMLVVARDEESAVRLRDDLSLVAPGGSVHAFVRHRYRAGFSRDLTAQRADVESLRALQAESAYIVVTDPAGIATPLPPPEKAGDRTFTLTAGAAASLSGTVRRLEESGFERKDFVTGHGDFAVRGGILDIYSFVGSNPIRAEFTGDSIESLREFDPLSQRSLRPLSVALVVPDLASSESGSTNQSSLLEYLRPDALLVLEDPALILTAVEDDPAKEPLVGRERLSGLFDRFARLELLSLSGGNEQVLDFGGQPQPAFNGSVLMARRAIAAWQEGGVTVAIGCDAQSELTRLKELLQSAETEIDPAGQLPAGSGAALNVDRIQFSLDALHAGFVLHRASLAVLAEHQIFNRLKRRSRRGAPRSRGFSARELGQLRKGDYVVHQDFGIGRFDGLRKIRVRNAEQEVVSVLYEENDRLYVNLNYLQKLQKYSSKEGHIPRLTRLGSAEWERLKSRAKKRVKDIARDLITLYARRKQAVGHAFQKDTPWQQELEASFMYEDTFDQAQATRDVKEDMEALAPMDRLICGDVGFGKTEVAVRASFKAVLDGKQVAVLVPTTILAMQHFATFRERMARYGLGIEVLSRFKTKKEQQDVVVRLKEGAIDILIGTHRILSKDVAFKNLGLLIIDEEHRFGVSAKEKLRRMKAEVDTLSLTATPIPRTLHFSLMGARDLSIIATPPRNRLPILTETAGWDDRLIHDAVMREIHRGGQVYFVHDRVQKMEEVTERLRRILPDVRMHAVHGQMHAHALEGTMVEFLERKFELLVCTKIIESGLDIPNVNTIIINRADRFGMAELYQLRGRVGRSNIQAYAYLIIPPVEILPRSTLQRLQAVEEFTELGSGLNLAMRDLEIRGAGNLLGSEQSGFIESMGFETYTRILDEAVRELKNDEFKEMFKDRLHPSAEAIDTSIDAGVDAFIPEEYIAADTERLAIYRRIYALRNRDQIKEIREELRDRFGTLPPEAENLLTVVQLRLASTLRGFRKITLEESTLEAEFPPESETAYYDGEIFRSIMQLIPTLPRGEVSLKQRGKSLVLVARLPAADGNELPLAPALRFVESLPAPGTQPA